MSSRELEFYATPGPITNLSGCEPDALKGLPDTPAELAKVVRGCVVDGLPLPEGRNDPQIRPVSAMIGRIHELEPLPLVEPRPPAKRFIGTCRHFATLTCALLRHKGIPTRVRAGFAGYFEADIWVDHWIIEYWRTTEERWVRVDPEYGEEWFKARDPNATSESVAGSKYLSGGEAWQRCRRGDLDPSRFKMGGVNWGIGEVRGSVLYDLAALNKDEMLPWDTWSRMEAAYKSETDAAYDTLLDTVGRVTGAADFEAVRELYQEREELRVPPEMASRAAV